MKELWYASPAACWEETLPLGNGSLGAMVWGDPLKERIGMNHERLWSGTGTTDPKDKRDHRSDITQAREWIFQGEYEKAEHWLEENVLGEYTESYMPAGDLRIELPLGEIRAYRRSLSLDLAEAVVEFDLQTDEKTSHVRRTLFTSHPEKALFIRQSSNEPTDVDIFFESPERMIAADADKMSLALEYMLPEHVDPSYLGERENAILWGERGMKYPVQIRVLSCDGEIHMKENERIRIRNAREWILAVTILESDVKSELTWDEHTKLHRKDFGSLYDRADLELYPDRTDLSTDVRLKDPDPGLYALYFQYGRYLLISSSRKGGLPATLQGIWSWQMRAPWSSNYTTNINLEMNYWPALVTNLEECDEVYLDFIRKVCTEGKKTAAAFGCQGSCCGHNSDGYVHTYPVGVARGEDKADPASLMWAFYLMAEVWMDEEVYREFQYHPSERLAKETVYPLLRESVLFVLDWLTSKGEWLVTCPATTPENRFLWKDYKVSASYATTMDMTMIRELFRNYSRIVSQYDCGEESRELLNRVKSAEKRLYPQHLNRDGSVCEWFEEQEEVEKGHRHVSHLYGLFPSDLWRGDNAMEDAVRKTLENRMTHGGGHTGWSLSWILNLYTVLKDRTAVSRYLKQMFERSTYPNLWDKHPPFQIDGNFGMTAAIAYMLVEETEGEPQLLPCLPEEWQEGKVRGFCLPGNRTIGFEWKNGTVVPESVQLEMYER